MTKGNETLVGRLQALIDAVDLARDERSIRNAIKNFTSSSGFDRFAYIQVRADDVTAFTDYPVEWQNLYFERHYAIIDPVVTTAKRGMRMFAWSAEDQNVRKSSREIKQFYSEAIDFGIRSGISIPIRTSYGRTAMITLASDRQQIEAPSWDPMQAALALSYVHTHLNLASVTLKTGVVTLSTQEATSLS